MLRSKLGILCLTFLLFGCSPPPFQTIKMRSTPKAVQAVFNVPGPVYITNNVGGTAAMVTNVTLKLVREYTTSNQLVTYWTLDYQYYNGKWTWEYNQWLYIDFVDQYGVVLVSNVIGTETPSDYCHYGSGVHAYPPTGVINFDFTNPALLIHIAPHGTTLSGGSPGTDHRC